IDKSWVLSRAFSPDGRKLVIASQTRPNQKWAMTLFEVTTGEVVHRFDNFQKPVLAPAVSPRGNVLASGAADGSIHLWHLESGKELRTLRGHQDAILSLAFSADGNRLVSGSRDATALVWDVRKVLPAAVHLQPEELRGLWSDLLGEAPKAIKAVGR